MTSRAKAANVPTREDPDGSYPESSPDPLAASINDHRARIRRIATRPKQPLASSSPSKQNRTASYAEIEATSPSKSMILSTPRGSGASPWRIKVTVEAEPGSDEENLESPTVKRVTRTKTTTVPLRDADATSPVKRRGRPRKSDATSAKPKRSGTPAKKTAKSKTRRSSVGAEDSVADVDTDAPPKKRRGRPRKSIQPPNDDAESATIDESLAQDMTVLEETHLAPELNETAEIEYDTAAQQPSNEEEPELETTLATPQEQQLSSAKATIPIRRDSPQTELSERIRARRGTPARNDKVVLEISSDAESDADSDVHTPSGTDEETPAPQHLPTVEAMTFEAPEYEDIDEVDGLQDAADFALEEGATRMPDDTTVLESENFSMISVDSLPSSGGLTSPVYGPTGRTPTGPSLGAIHYSAHLQNLTSEVHQPQRSPAVSQLSSGLSDSVQPTVNTNLSPLVAPSRHKTPSNDSRSPSQPPPIVQTELLPTEAATPKIGRVVKAGVALQGLLEPNRITPTAGPSRIIDEDIFRGFSESTRKELQAGLRLGEQLAQQDPTSLRGSPARSSPIKAHLIADATDDVFPPQTGLQQPRLLTPEDHDDYRRPSPSSDQQGEVKYPSLNVSDQDSQLPSPERSDDEMSWRVDTPPVHGAAAAEHRFSQANDGAGFVIRGYGLSTASNEIKQNIRGRQASRVTDQKEGNNDIWEEEASRSSISPESESAPAESIPQLQVQEGIVKPARGKLPRTWRRKSSGNFQYSDEAEEIPDQTPSSTESDESPAKNSDKGKNKVAQTVTQVEDLNEDDELSEASDDTGMFFTHNLPSVFNKRRSPEFRKKKAEKLDLSLLMHEGESLLPESSPPVAKVQTPGISKVNPFLDTPPRFAMLQSSPVKSSPLRYEVRASDTSSEPISIPQGFEESTLPVLPSSPFHTQVDGESMFTAASDQRQFQEEMMAGATDSSLRNIRNEADDYLDAYEAQERTLGEIEEVTEPSRTWNKESEGILPSSPMKQAFEESMIRPARTYPLLFGEKVVSADPASSQVSELEPTPERTVTSVAKPKPEEAVQPPQASSGVFGRLTSTLWSALGSAPPPPAHPILAKFDRLPKVEPWTKTHYKTLDALYQRHKKQPALFLPSSSTRTTNTNNAILADFLRSHKRPFVGAQYSAWGYSVTLNESLVVLCAVYMQLLVLKDVSEYEEEAGKQIQMGDCGPGANGEEILAEEVIKRLATVIMGEELRKDEKRGVEVDRSGGLTIMWPA